MVLDLLFQSNNWGIFPLKPLAPPNSSVAVPHPAGKLYWVMSPLFEEMRKFQTYQGSHLSDGKVSALRREGSRYETRVYRESP
ncbi:hypothetical protein AVEN_68108-1 [Araneus ventricosus]|uniref:Uncharacterized protein n=1 Tax=Araneus ventricosus TaxID=182803 RepID=A0A4Y2J084_ARAVE|nr:hypothetical protein AVEN_68108-1 [Araneus ventricosus]